MINLITFETYTSFGGWVNSNTNNLTTVTVIGFVHRETDEILSIKQGTNNFNQDMNIINIPKQAIKRRQELKEVLSDETSVLYKSIEIQPQSLN